MARSLSQWIFGTIMSKLHIIGDFADIWSADEADWTLEDINDLLVKEGFKVELTLDPDVYMIECETGSHMVHKKITNEG